MSISSIWGPPCLPGSPSSPRPSSVVPARPMCGQNSQTLLMFPSSWNTPLSCWPSPHPFQRTVQISPSPEHLQCMLISLSLLSRCTLQLHISDLVHWGCEGIESLVRNEEQVVITPKTTSYILLEMVIYLGNDHWEPARILSLIEFGLLTHKEMSTLGKKMTCSRSPCILEVEIDLKT